MRNPDVQATILPARAARLDLDHELLLVMARLCMTVSNTSANSLLQANARARIRGQTVSLYMLVMRGGLSVGSLLTGICVHLFGVRDALLINGVVALMAQGLIGRYWLSQSTKATAS